MRKFITPALSALLITTGAVSTAFAQDNSHEDRFKPRIYGSIAAPATSSTYQTDAERAEAARALAYTIRDAEAAPVIYDGTVYMSSHDADSSDYNRLMEEAESVRIYQGRNSGKVAETPHIPYRPSVPVTQGQLQEIPLFESERPVVMAKSTSSSISHRIVKGDTLYNLSKRYNVSLNEIRTANSIYGDDITIGEVLSIPVLQSVHSAPYHEQSTQPYIFQEPQIRTIDANTGIVYAVLPKDTLYSISRTTCTDVKDLIAVNRIASPDSLKPGQRLNLPSNHCLTR